MYIKTYEGILVKSPDLIKAECSADENSIALYGYIKSNNMMQRIKLSSDFVIGEDVIRYDKNICFNVLCSPDEYLMDMLGKAIKHGEKLFCIEELENEIFHKVRSEHNDIFE